MYGMEFASMLTHSDSINWHSKTKLGNQDDNKFMLTAKPHSHILNKQFGYMMNQNLLIIGTSVHM